MVVFCANIVAAPIFHATQSCNFNPAVVILAEFRCVTLNAHREENSEKARQTEIEMKRKNKNRERKERTNKNNKREREREDRTRER